MVQTEQILASQLRNRDTVEPSAAAKKVCHVLLNNAGGSPRLAEAIVRHQARLGWETTVIFVEGKSSGWCCFADATAQVELSDIAWGKKFLPKLLFYFLRDLRRACGLRNAIEGLAPDVVIAHDHIPIRLLYLLSLVSGRSRRPFIAYIHSTFPQIKVKLAWSPSWIARLAHRLECHLALSASAVIFVCRTLRESYQKLGFNHPHSSVSYSPILDEVSVPLIEQAKRWFEDRQLHTFVTAARLDAPKDHVTVLRAFELVLRDIRSARLIILGDGPQKEMLNNLTEELGIADAVLFCGFVENPRDYFSKSSAVILSSLWEGFPLVLIEALKSGTPFIASDCPGGIREIIDLFGYGSLFQTGDAVALAAAIEKHIIHRPVIHLEMDQLNLNSKETFLSHIDREVKRILNQRS